LNRKNIQNNWNTNIYKYILFKKLITIIVFLIIKQKTTTKKNYILQLIDYRKKYY